MSIKKMSALLLCLLVFSSCSSINNNSSLSSSIESEDDSSDFEESSESISSEEEIIENTITIDLTNTMSSIDVSNNANASSFIEDSFNSFEDISFSDFTYSKVYCDNGGVKLGSSSAFGTLTFTSNLLIKEMIIVGRPYAKMDNYNNIFNVDESATIGVNDTYSNESYTVESIEDSFEYSFKNISSNNISISSSLNPTNSEGKGRFTIFSLKITY